MKNLLLRSTTGLIYVALICFSVLSGGWIFIALFSLFTLLALHEFYHLCNSQKGSENTTILILDLCGGVVMCAGMGCVNLGLLPPVTTAVVGGTFFILYLLYLVIRLVTQLYIKEESPLSHLAYSYMGQMYIALPLGLMSMYYTFPDGKSLLLGMFVMIWLSDTGAFLVGSAIGKHKLFPRISPNKSWEGFFGGLLFCLAASFIYKYCFPTYFSSINILTLCGMGLMVGIFATWGDLVESLIKRTLGVKDSGHLLPGHGGILDRIDSLLLVIPATLIYLTYISIW